MRSARILLALRFGVRLGGQTVTFSEHVAPILFHNCAICHRPGEAGPFTLLSYQHAQSRGRQIAEVTASGYMPPWKPEAG
jgi:mono/diheme cytochrome c family protein